MYQKSGDHQRNDQAEQDLLRSDQGVLKVGSQTERKVQLTVIVTLRQSEIERLINSSNSGKDKIERRNYIRTGKIYKIIREFDRFTVKDYQLCDIVKSETC